MKHKNVCLFLHTTEVYGNTYHTDAVIGLIVTLLAKHRRPQLSLFQKIIVSLILYSGHCSKKVSDACAMHC